MAAEARIYHPGKVAPETVSLIATSGRTYIEAAVGGKAERVLGFNYLYINSVFCPCVAFRMFRSVPSFDNSTPLQLGYDGAFAGGGNISLRGWGVVGESGPEIIKGPGAVIPMRSSGSEPVKITFVDQAGVQLSARETQVPDGRHLGLMVKKTVDRQVSDSYSGASRTMAARGAGPSVTKR